MAPRGGARATNGEAGSSTRGASRGRGGARGRGRGRGDYLSSTKQRIGGQEVSWDYDPELEVDDAPRETYPVC